MHSSKRSELSLLTPFTAPQTHSLTVFLQFGDELVTLLHHICVLLVLVVWPVGFNDAVDSVDGTRNSVSRNEFGKVPRSL
jgi:hypothetical protein